MRAPVPLWRQLNQLRRSLRDATRHRKFTNPKDGLFEIPDELVPLTSDAGQQKLAHASVNQSLLAALQRQEHPAFCGIAAAVTVARGAAAAQTTPKELSATLAATEQRRFFQSFQELKKLPPLFVHFGFGLLDGLPRWAKLPVLEYLKYDGIPLAVLAEWFRAVGFIVESVSAGTVNEDIFREDIAAAFDKSPRSCGTRRILLANYSRLAVGQRQFSGGHYAALGAHLQAPGSQDVLLLEVNQFRYPSVWVNISSLWNAVHTQAGNGSWRGYLRLDIPSSE